MERNKGNGNDMRQKNKLREKLMNEHDLILGFYFDI